MSVVYILVFAAILMAGGFLVAFIWSVKSGQYDDTYTPSVRILFDDAVKKEEKSEVRRPKVGKVAVFSRSWREERSWKTEVRSRKTGKKEH